MRVIWDFTGRLYKLPERHNPIHEVFAVVSAAHARGEAVAQDEYIIARMRLADMENTLMENARKHLSNI